MVTHVNPAVEKLLALQEQEAKKLTLESQLTLIPLEVAKSEAKIAEERAAIEADKQALKQIEVQRVDVDNEMKSLEAQVIKYKNQQMEVKKNEEYQALIHEIETLEQSISDLESRELELMLQQDEQGKAAQASEAEHLEQIRLFEKDIARLREQEAGVKGQIGQVTADAAEAATAVPELWLAGFRRAQQRRAKPLWAVTMHDQHCNGCHLKVSGEVEGGVLMDQEPVFCDSCGRLIYKD